MKNSVRVLVTVAAVLAAPSMAVAATFTVNSTLDAVDAVPGDGVCATAGAVCTLRAAIQEANALAGADTIIVPAGTYTLTIAGSLDDAAATGDLDITSTVVIVGAGADVTTVNAAGIDRVFDVLTGANATVRGLRITGGNVGGGLRAGGGIRVTLATLVIERCAIVGNTGDVGGGLFSGGGLVSLGGGPIVTITDTEISGNTATLQGGGIDINTGGTLVLTNSTVSGNAANFYGGVATFGNATITNTTIAANTAAKTASNLVTAFGTTTLRNTLVVSTTGGINNCDTGTLDVDGGGNFAAGGPCGTIPATAAVGTTLGALALNAPGATATQALLPGNPAIRGAVAAFCPSADQRGVTRSGVPCDSGAYQSSAPATPTPTPTPGPGPGVAPTISAIADQTLQQNGGVTIPFTISGGIIDYALRTTATTSNPSLFPSLGTSVACDQLGHCTLQVTPADGRGGSAVVTIAVTDGTNTTTRSFNVMVTIVRPTAPGVTLANVVGSGVALTWTVPDTGTPVAYAVAWGTASGASTQPVQLVSGTVGRLDFSSLPNGTYYFRVYAIGAGDVSAASPQTSATVTSSATAPGPPLALQLAGNARITATWRAPSIGSAPTLYEVHVGSALGLEDVGSATTAATAFDASVNPGTYWVRTRGASGGAVGAWSSSVQVPIGTTTPCASAPTAPTLLPVASAGGEATLLWLAAGGSPADYYQLQLSPGAGLAPVYTVGTSGPSTSALWPQAGTFAARVVAINGCGASGRSNEVTFNQP